MQALPPRAAQAFDHFRGGGDSERDQQHKAQKAYRDEGACDHVRHDLLHDEKLVEPDVCQEMQPTIEEGEEPEHTAQLDQSVPARETTGWSDSEGDEYKAQRPQSGLLGDLLDGVRIQIV